MHNRLNVLCATALALALAGCHGSDDNHGLAEGANDNPTANNGSTGIGPGAPPVDSHSPAEGNSASQPGQMTGPAGPTLVLVQQGPRAPYVTNGAGNAVYWVDGDMDGTKCTGPCLQTWPPVTAGGVQPSGAPGLQGAQIASITRPDGTMQVTFEGHPLYRYAADAAAGATNGDGVKDKFGTWHLAVPTGGATGAGASPASGMAPATSGSGSGAAATGSAAATAASTGAGTTASGNTNEKSAPTGGR